MPLQTFRRSKWLTPFQNSQTPKWILALQDDVMVAVGSYLPDMDVIALSIAYAPLQLTLQSRIMHMECLTTITFESNKDISQYGRLLGLLEISRRENLTSFHNMPQTLCIEFHGMKRWHQISRMLDMGPYMCIRAFTHENIDQSRHLSLQWVIMYLMFAKVCTGITLLHFHYVYWYPPISFYEHNIWRMIFPHQNELTTFMKEFSTMPSNITTNIEHYSSLTSGSYTALQKFSDIDYPCPTTELLAFQARCKCFLEKMIIQSSRPAAWLSLLVIFLARHFHALKHVNISDSDLNLHDVHIKRIITVLYGTNIERLQYNNKYYPVPKTPGACFF
jgi:hypothetical protein